MEKLSITITQEHAHAIRDRIESGEFGSASEVIRAALRSLAREETEYRERIESIRQRIQASIDDPRPPLSEEEMDRHLESLFERGRIRAENAPRKG